MRSFAAVPPLAALARGRDNNLNLLRMIAAALVLYAHSYALVGRPDASHLLFALGHLRTEPSTIGVAAFFAISGFLVAGSLERTPSLAAYARARFLRIVPGLVASTLFSVAVIGWSATRLSTAEYWTHGGTWEYVWRTLVLSLDARPGLPGVFERNPFPVAVNGSLWTIPVEVWCYALLAVIAALGVLRRRLLLAAVVAVALAAFAIAPTLVKAWLPMDARFTTPQLVATFLFGSLLHAFRERVRLSLVAVCAIPLAVFATRSTPLGPYALFGGIAYAVLVLAYHPAVQVRSYLKAGDYSYGTYVLAFPIQQWLVWALGPVHPLALCGLALACTLPLAMLSWHFVERPALALKRSGSAEAPASPARRGGTSIA